MSVSWLCWVLAAHLEELTLSWRHCHGQQCLRELQLHCIQILLPAYLFHFCAALSSLLVKSLLWLTLSVKCHRGFSLGDKETTAGFAICGWTEYQMRGDRTDFQGSDWSWIVIPICYLHSDLCAEVLGAKFALYANTVKILCSTVTKIWPVLLGHLCYLTTVW